MTLGGTWVMSRSVMQIMFICSVPSRTSAEKTVKARLIQTITPIGCLLEVMHATPSILKHGHAIAASILMWPCELYAHRPQDGLLRACDPLPKPRRPLGPSAARSVILLKHYQKRQQQWVVDNYLVDNSIDTHTTKPDNEVSYNTHERKDHEHKD